MNKISFLFSGLCVSYYFILLTLVPQLALAQAAGGGGGHNLDSNNPATSTANYLCLILGASWCASNLPSSIASTDASATTPTVATSSAPTISLSISSQPVTVGSPFTLTWTSSGAESCDLVHDGTNNVCTAGNNTCALNKTRTFTAVNLGAHSFTLTCFGNGRNSSSTINYNVVAAAAVTPPPYSACYLPTEKLSLGATGSAVIDLQTYLTSQGDLATSSSKTGYFGKNTEEALQEWQAAHNIVSSGDPSSTGWGTLGLRTITAIKSSCADSSSASGSVINPYTGTFVAADQLSDCEAAVPVIDVEGNQSAARKSATHVYDGFCNSLVGATPSSFVALDYWYGKDSTEVWLLSSPEDGTSYSAQIVAGADPATFTLIPDSSSGQFPNEQFSADYTKDKNHVYLDGLVVSGADPVIFTIPPAPSP